METSTKLILSQLKHTQAAADNMTEKFIPLAGAVEGLKTETANQGKLISSLDGKVTTLSGQMATRGEQTGIMKTEIDNLKASHIEMKRDQQRINLKTVEGWRQIAPYLVLGLAALFGLFRDNISSLF